MVEKHAFPGKEMIGREADDAVIHRDDIGAQWRSNIFPVMGIFSLPIDDALPAEGACDRPFDRSKKIARPSSLRRDGLEHRANLRLFRFHANEVVFIEIDLVLRQGQMLDRSFFFHDDNVIAHSAMARHRCDVEYQFMRTGRIL